MKNLFNKKRICILSFFFLIVSGSLYAQLGVRSVGINLGIFSPKMDYWNDNALGTWSEKFGAGFYGQINLEFNVIQSVGARVEIGFWQQSLTQSGIPFGKELRSDKISIQFLPLTLDAFYKYPISTSIELYGGAGAGMNMNFMEYTITIPNTGENKQTKNGTSFIWHLMIGGNYKVAQNIALGAEIKYLFGKYVQETMTGTTTFKYDVSIAGPQFMVTAKYLF